MVKSQMRKIEVGEQNGKTGGGSNRPAVDGRSNNKSNNNHGDVQATTHNPLLARAGNI